MKIFAILLIVVGVLGIGYGGVTWTQREKVVDLGPVQIDHDKTKSVPIPPIAGALCLAAGIVVLMSQKRT